MSHEEQMADAARSVLTAAMSRPPTLGGGRLVCVDGPAGSGKSTLAAAVRSLEPRARVVQLDDLYAGWQGLSAVGGRIAGLLDPLARGEAGRYERWDWHASAFVEEVTVEPCELLVLDGVGSFSGAYAGLVTLLVWISAPLEERTARVLARDGAASAPYLERWQADETIHHAAHGTLAHADLLVDSSGTPT